MINYFKKFQIVVFFCLILICNNSTFGCSCNVVPPCVSYTEAVKVFVGKLQSISEIEQATIPSVYVKFSVEKVYKGDLGKTELVKFETGGCKRTFKLGESYFVYVYDDINFSRQYCDRTDILSNASLDINYVNDLTENNPKFSIFGDIYGVSESDLNNLNVQIKNDDERFNVLLNSLGHYNFNAVKDKKYEVQITIPFEAEIYTNDVNINYENGRSVIKYSTKFSKNGCSYRAFNVTKQK